MVLNRFRGELVMLDGRSEGSGGGGGSRSGGMGEGPGSFERGEMDDEIPF